MVFLPSSIKTALLSISVFFAAGWLSPSASMAFEQVNQTFFGTAIKGYDTVAYHTDNRAVKGKREFSHVWRDAKWLFASAQHRDLFAADPEAYAPQYGGY